MSPRRWFASLLITGLATAVFAGLPAISAQAASGHRPELGIAAGGTLQFETVAQQRAYLSSARALGATWLRFDVTWNDIQRSNASDYDWARYDTLISLARADGLQVVGMIGYAPQWARDSACAGDQMCRPADPAAYGRFAGAVAKRYGPRGVHHWEIWNEPNTALFFRPTADPAYYTRMLTSAYTAIHRADPRAEVITGGTAPASTGGGNYTPVDFVKGMYAAGAEGHFDILGHHPYCYAGTFNCPGTEATWSAWSQMSDTGTSLRGLMRSHGDGGDQIWATEFGAPTSGGNTSVSEAQQSKMLSDGVRRFARYSWSGPLFVYSLQDRGTNAGDKEDWFGVLRADGSRKPAFRMLSGLMDSVLPVGPGNPGSSANPGRKTGPSGIGAPVATATAPSTASAAPTPGAMGDPGTTLEPVPVSSTNETIWWKQPWILVLFTGAIVLGAVISGAKFRKKRDPAAHR